MAKRKLFFFIASYNLAKRQLGDLNPCGQSPADFKSASLTTRTSCLLLLSEVLYLFGHKDMRMWESSRRSLYHPHTSNRSVKDMHPGRFELPPSKRTRTWVWRLNQLGHGCLWVGRIPFRYLNRRRSRKHNKRSNANDTYEKYAAAIAQLGER